jgi:hypothetical protein
VQQTQKTKKRLYYANPILLFDWVIASVCFFLGWVGIQTVTHVDTWNIWFENDFSRVDLAHYHKLKGFVRSRKQGFMVWEDTLQGILQDGDELKTKEDTTAILDPSNHIQATLLSSSLLQLYTETSHSNELFPQTRSIESWLMGTHPPIPITFKLVRGTLELQLNEIDSRATLELDGIRYEIDSDNQNGTVRVTFNPSDHSLLFFPRSPSPIKLKHLSKNQTVLLRSGVLWKVQFLNQKLELISLENEPTAPKDLGETKKVSLFVPEILSPLNEARYISNVNEREEISLKWKTIPSQLRPDIQLRRLDDPDFRPHIEPRSSGLVLSLPDGHYSWRVRTVDAKGRKSEWTPFRSFSVQENVRGATPVAVLESRKMEELNEKKLLENRTEQLKERERKVQRTLAQEHSTRRQKTLELQAKYTHAESQADQIEQEGRDKWKKKKYEPIALAARTRIEDLTHQSSDQTSGQIRTHPIAHLIRVDDSERQQKPANLTSSAYFEISWTPVPHAESYEMTLFSRGLEIQTEQVHEPFFRIPMKEALSTPELSYKVSTDSNQTQPISSVITPISLQITPPNPVEPILRSKHSPKKAIEFTWSTHLPLEAFDFEVAKDIDFTTVVHRNTVNEKIAVFAIEQPGDYFWRVRGKTHEILSDWSLPIKIYIRIMSENETLEHSAPHKPSHH